MLPTPLLWLAAFCVIGVIVAKFVGRHEDFFFPTEPATRQKGSKMINPYRILLAIVVSVLLLGFALRACACGNNCGYTPTDPSLAQHQTVGDTSAKAGAVAGAKASGIGYGGSVGNVSTTASGGDGGEATVTTTDARTYIDQSRSMTAVQPGRLPDAITLGSLTLQAKGECGRRHVITPFTRTRHTPKLLGLWSTQEDVQTAHGLDDGPAAQPFVTETVEIPATNERITTVYGHRLYVTVGTDGSNGASSMAANHDNGNFYGLGAGNAAGMNYGVVGYVALECEYRVKTSKIVEDQIKFDPPAAGKPTTGPCEMKDYVRNSKGVCHHKSLKVAKVDYCELCAKMKGK